MAKLSFDSTNVPTASAFDVLKPGWYVGQITGSALNQTNAQDGHYLALEFTLIGDHNGEKSNGRKVWTNLNIDNPNPKTVQIAQEQLSAICHAVGKLQVGDSEELHGKPLQLKLKVQPAKGQYDARNDIQAYKAVDGAGVIANPIAPPVAPPVAQQQAPAPVPAPAPAPAPGLNTGSAPGVPSWAQGGQ